jgi:hypothetical protein
MRLVLQHSLSTDLIARVALAKSRAEQVMERNTLLQNKALVTPAKCSHSCTTSGLGRIQRVKANTLTPAQST